MDKIIKEINKSYPGNNYNLFYYADDCLVVANSAQELRGKINIIKYYYNKLGLKINDDKSEILICGKGDEESINNIKVVKKIKYLGVNITNNRNIYKEYINEKLTRAEKYKNYINYILHGKILKTQIGKTLWKAAILPSITHGMQAMKISQKNIQKLNTIQNTIMKQLLNLPSHTPNAYIQGEIGYSKQQYRDMKSKIGLLHHIVCNTNKLKNLILNEWGKGHKWIETCKEYLEKINIKIEELDSQKIIKIKETINKIENDEWKEEMTKRNSLQYYQKYKLEIKEKLWENTKTDNVIKKFQSGTITRNWKENKCKLCSENFSIEHVTKECKELTRERQEYGINIDTEIDEILQFKHNKTFIKYLIDIDYKLQ